MKALLADLDKESIDSLVRLSMKYPPSARALLGALLEDMEMNTELGSLKKSLNLITVYKYSLTGRDLPTIQNWNIV